MARRPKAIWNNVQVIGAVEKSDRTMIQVELVARRGVKYVNLREWYKRADETLWRPNGIAGFNIPVLMPINGTIEPAASQLVELIQDAIYLAPTFDLDDPEKTVWGKKKNE